MKRKLEMGQLIAELGHSQQNHLWVTQEAKAKTVLLELSHAVTALVPAPEGTERTRTYYVCILHTSQFRKPNSHLKSFAASEPEGTKIFSSFCSVVYFVVSGFLVAILLTGRYTRVKKDAEQAIAQHLLQFYFYF